MQIVWPKFVLDRIGDARRRKGPQAPGATVAHAARLALALVARPAEMERRIEFQPAPDDLRLVHGDERRHDFYARLGPRAEIDDLVEGVVKDFAAVGIARRILLDRADVDAARTDHLRPARGHREEIGVTKRHVTGGNFSACEVGGANGNRRVGERRAADGAEEHRIDLQPVRNAVMVANLPEAFKLLAGRPLPVIDMHGRQLKPLVTRQRGSHQAIHPATDQKHSSHKFRSI